MDFISIDFETATSDRNSPCEIGLTFIRENRVFETKSWLIKPIQYPYFDSFNVHLHGISPKDVAKHPEFDVLWRNEILPLVDGNFLMAHNAGFDFSVLRKTLETYSLPFPELQYSCSYIISKKIIKGLLSYDLSSLCHYSKISLPSHRAGDDSKACAELSLKLFETAGVSSFEEFPSKLATSIGRLYSGGYKPSLSKYEDRSKSHNEIQGDPEKSNPNSMFYQAKVVFTGALSSMTRAEAWEIIADIGGINTDTVSRDTDFLIVGEQDFRKVGEDGMSRKQEKAQDLLSKGAEIEVLSESDFLRSIGQD